MTIPAGFGQVSLNFNGTACPSGATVTFGVENSTGLTATEVAGRTEFALEDAVMHIIWSSDAAIFNIHVKLGPDETGPAADLGVSIIGQRNVSGSPGTATLVHKTTALGGRQGRGRNYWPAVAEQDFGASGAIDPAQRVAVDGVLFDFMEKMVVAECGLVVLHGDSLTPTPVIALTCDGRVATQRRRLRR